VYAPRKKLTDIKGRSFINIIFGLMNDLFGACRFYVFENNLCSSCVKLACFTVLLTIGEDSVLHRTVYKVEIKIFVGNSNGKRPALEAKEVIMKI
jgi:hypothetical protein